MKTRVESSLHDLLAAVSRRRSEIGQAVLVRARAIGFSEGSTDPEYLEGLRMAVEAAIDHTVEASGGDYDRSPQVPGPLLAQARLAARRGVPLETMLRRYLAGHTVLGDFFVEEAERLRVPPAVLRKVLRSQAAQTDRVLAVISATYLQEADSVRPLSRARRLKELVRRMLDGELVDPNQLDYDLERWHVGLLLRGAGVDGLVGNLAERLDGTRLEVTGEDGLLWAWLGLRERPEPDRVSLALTGLGLDQGWVGIGEPGWGRPGWRLTHHQACAALSVVARTSERIARYADVALLASAMQDELLSTSLRVLYLEPLDEHTSAGGVLRDTLRAYLGTDGNVTSAAAALGVSRNTVGNRLRAVEARIGPLRPSRTRDLALALQLEDLDYTEHPVSLASP